MEMAASSPTRPSLPAVAGFGRLHGAPCSLLASVPATIMSKERPRSRIIGTVPRGARSTICAVLHRGIWVAAEEHRHRGIQARSRRRPAAVQNVIVGIVKREQTWLLYSRLCQYRRCGYQRQNGCRAKYLESGHGLSPRIGWRRDSAILAFARMLRSVTT